MIPRRIEGWINTNKLELDTLHITGYAKIDYVNVDKLSIIGVLISNYVKANRIEIQGFTKANEIHGNEVVVKGLVDVTKLDANNIMMKGRIIADTIKAKRGLFELTGTSKARRIEVLELIVKSLSTSKTRGRLIAEELYARSLHLEFTNSRLVACCDCSLGELNRIERFFYGNIRSLDPSTVFLFKPLAVSSLCTRRNESTIDLVLPTTSVS
ncbi:MAG: hypothetical protein DRO40_12775 [Thermoprotei archaeon]|nr:MAG: hypothetical protein DRO40_12775 [Thermoprotei archaeon]